MPSREGLIDRFESAGLAASAAPIAADNFLASAIEAGAAPEEGQRRVFAHDLPFDAASVQPKRTAVRGSEAAATKRTESRSQESPKRDAPPPPPPPPLTTGAPGIDIRIDVSGWEVDKVVELIQKLKSAG